MATIGHKMCVQPCVVLPDDSLQHAAMLMAENGIGSLPVVAADGRLLGMLSDRDIVVRAVAEGWDACAPVRLAMSRMPQFCRPWENASEVALRMAVGGMQRLPVVDDAHCVVGIVTHEALAPPVARRRIGQWDAPGAVSRRPSSH